MLLGMPLILITILGFALGSVLDGSVQTVTGKAALIMHTSEEAELSVFKNALAEVPMPEKIQDQLYEQAESFSPVSMLKHEIFGNEELQSIITLEELPASKLQEVKKAGQYSAVIEVPAQFTSRTLESLFIEEKAIPPLTVYTNEGKELSAAIVEDVMAGFQEQYSVWAALGKEGLLNEVRSMSSSNVSGSIETLTKKKPIGAFSYYAVGMSVMFVLFIASSISSGSFMEKKWNVFDRILLANVPKWTYVLSVFLSTVAIAFLQIIILYTGAALLYGVRWPDLAAFLCVTLALCTAVGGISVFLMSLNNRLGSESASKLFMSAFVAVLAFVGGSFTPVGNMSEWLEKIGRMTPNGAAMSAYFDIMQGTGVSGVADHIWILLLLTAVLLAASWLVFPRKVGAA